MYSWFIFFHIENAVESTVQMKTGRQVISMDDLPKTLAGSSSDDDDECGFFIVADLDAFFRLMTVLLLLNPKDFIFNKHHWFILPLKRKLSILTSPPALGELRAMARRFLCNIFQNVNGNNFRESLGPYKFTLTLLTYMYMQAGFMLKMPIISVFKWKVLSLALNWLQLDLMDDNKRRSSFGSSLIICFC